VWGIDFEGGDRAVDGRIKALRAALGPAGKQIRTVFKVGYKLEEGAHG
jgi:two-component system response regulator ResD